MNFELNNTIKMLNKYSNVDALYGPYDSAAQACATIPTALRRVGLTIAIYDIENGVVEYWWKKGTNDYDLEEKSFSYKLNLSIPAGADRVSANPDGKTFTLAYILTGKSILKEARLLLNGVLVSSFLPQTSVDGTTPKTETFTLPNEIGVYQYRILVVDIFGQSVTSETYTLSYGTIRASFNMSLIKNVVPKTPAMLNGVAFLAQVNTVDVAEYRPTSIKFGSTTIYTFDGTESYPWVQDLTLPNNLPVEDNVCAKLVYNNTSEIEDSYKTSIIDSNTASIEVLDDSYSTYVGRSLHIPFKINSGNSAFLFDVTLTINGTEYKYQNVPGNLNRDFFISSILPDLVITEPTTFSATLTAQERNDSSISDSKTISITLRNISVNDPYEKLQNCFLFNINKQIRSAYNFSNSTLLLQPNPIAYYNRKDTIVSSYNPQSFVLDIYVNISKSGQNKNILSVYELGNAENPIAQIKEEYVTINNVAGPADLYLENEYKHIGIVYNRTEYSEISKTNVNYSAIYIDGKLVKNSLLGSSEQQLLNPLVIEINPDENAVFDLSSIHIYAYGPGDELVCVIDDINKGEDLLYYNYVSNLNQRPDVSSVLKMKLVTINSMLSDRFMSINNKLRYLVPIGKIGKKTTSGLVLTLLEMTTAVKNTLVGEESQGKLQKQQKAVAAFCYYELTNLDNSKEYGIVEMHTQGTSTLDYSVPNFAFTFYAIESGNTLRKVGKTIVGDIPEKTLTAKADYMDSSHLNNTPTCTFYNQITANDEIIQNQSPARSKEYSLGVVYLDAIVGQPCIIEYVDNYNPASTDLSGLTDAIFNNLDFTNLGSFMLNIDKSGKSLGLDFVETNSYFEDNNIDVCYSLEGKSNIETSTEEEIVNPNAALFIYNDYIRDNYHVPDLAWNFSSEDWDDLTLEQLEAIKSYIFDGTAFEFRSDLDPEEWDDIESLRIYLYPIARMWYFVAKSSVEQFRNNFDYYFNRQYAFLYYINLMNFAQVDNLGKNSMFDTWDGMIWYPRPYDLDSENGFNNSGQDVIKTYEEILPTEMFSSQFSGSTDVTPENVQSLDNKNFSSKSSNLWKKLWSAFGSSDIKVFYATLRENGYSAESVIANAKSCVIDKLPANQYNIDFRNKYLGTVKSDQEKGFGDRWDRFRSWITKRFDFCDTYFGYTNMINFKSSANGSMKINTPQYVGVTIDQTSVGRQLALQIVNIPRTGDVVDHVSINPNNITEITNFNSISVFNITTKQILENLKLNNLLVLDVSNNLKLTSISNLYTQFNFLHTLNISNSAIRNIGDKLPSTVLNFYADGILFETNPLVRAIGGGDYESKLDQDSKLINLSLRGYRGPLILKDLPLLESVDLEGATLDKLRLENLPRLRSINITNCTFNGDVDIVNITKDVLDFSNCDFNNNLLTFSGTSSDIRILNLQNVKNLESIALDTLSTIEEIDCTESSISQIILNNLNNTLYKLYCSPNMNKIGPSNVADNTANMGNFNALRNVKFTGASTIKYIRDFKYVGSGVGLFDGCEDLLAITNSQITILNSCENMCRGCLLLTTISTITLSNDSTKPGYENNILNARAAFAKTHRLPLSTILGILNSVDTITNYNSTCSLKGYFGDGVTAVNLQEFFGNNKPNAIDYIFSNQPSNYAGGSNVDKYAKSKWNISTYSQLPSLTQIIGFVPSSVTTTFRAFCYNRLLTTISNDIFKASYKIVRIEHFFAGCDLQNVVFSEMTFGPAGTSVTQDGNTYTAVVTIDGEPITLSEIPSDYVDTTNNVLTSSLISVTGAFGANANLQFDVSSVNIFKNHPELKSVAAVFHNCENVYGDCSGIFYNNKKIEWFENIFNGTKVYLTSTLFEQNYTHTAEVYIGGMFGNRIDDQDASHKINVEFINQFSNIASLSAYTVYYDTGSNRVVRQGLFLGCTQLSGSWNAIKNKLEGMDCRRLFANSNVLQIFEPTVIELEIPSCTNIDRMFYNCNFSNLSNLQILSFGNIPIMSNAFARTTFSTVNDFSINFSEGAEDMSHLFAASNIKYNIANLDLPTSVVNTMYMFSRKHVSGYPATPTTAADSEIDTAYNMNNVTDYYERSASNPYTYSGPSNISGTVPQFGSSTKRLSKLLYTGHMFDLAAISSIRGGLFNYCPALRDCRYMFNYCTALTGITEETVDGIPTANIFTSDYPDLTDVSGMFVHTSLGGALRISFDSAPKLKRADCMFAQIHPQNTSLLNFTADNTVMFGSSNAQLRSITCFASNSNVLNPPSLRSVIGNLMYANYAFAFSDTANANVFGNDSISTSSLVSIRGMFYHNPVSTTDINNVALPGNASIIGNFNTTSIPSNDGNINIDSLEINYSSEIRRTQIDSWTVQPYGS